jgi:dTDP-4-dehydrorhamnose reductase
MIRSLVTGAAGLLGQHLVAELGGANTILAIDKAANPFPESQNIIYLQWDLIDFESIKNDIMDFNPELIFNCAAYTDVDGCEINKPLAHEINVKLVDNLLGLPYKKLIHFSTDYVFDGQNGPYGESDPTNPIGYYGQTKLESEQILARSERPYLIVRSNVLYGHAIDVRPNFISWLIDSFRQEKKLRLVTDQFNNPISAPNLSSAAIEAAAGNNTGILHIAGADYFSRYDIGRIVARHFKFNPRLIEPITTYQLGQKARRPLRGGLKIDKAKLLLKIPLLGLDQGLACMDDY